MRNSQIRRIDHEIAVEQNVDVYGPRPILSHAPAAQLLIDFRDAGELAREQIGLDLNYVQKPALIAAARAGG